MSRKIRVATTSLATLEDVRPPYNLRTPALDEIEAEFGLVGYREYIARCTTAQGHVARTME